MMKALAILPLGLDTLQLGMMLEVMQRRQDEGYEITVAVCRAGLPACDQNLRHSFVSCIRCIGAREAGVSAMRKPVRVVEVLEHAAEFRDQIAALPLRFASSDELTALHIGSFDVGWGALSTLVSDLREPAPDLEMHRDRLARLIVGASGVYLGVGRLLDEGFERGILFNGRIAMQRAGLRACQERSIPCDVVEQGGAWDRVTVFPGVMPHDVDFATKAIVQAWRAAPEDTRAADGAGFFLRAASSVQVAWEIYTASQREDALPAGFDVDADNVSLFVSSEDEYVAISDGWTYGVFPTQLDGIRFVIETCARDPRIHLYVRIHPALRGLDNTQTRGLRTLRGSGVTIIDADSPVSSYALLRSSRRVVTFGSTVGIEAAYWGVPSILVGQALYRQLGATYNPTTREELARLCTGNLAPKDREGALQYGHYYATLGDPFRHYQPRNRSEGTFRGRELAPTPTQKLAARALSTPLGAPLRLIARKGTASASLLALTGRPRT